PAPGSAWRAGASPGAAPRPRAARPARRSARTASGRGRTAGGRASRLELGVADVERGEAATGEQPAHAHAVDAGQRRALLELAHQVFDHLARAFRVDPYA